MDRAFGAHDPGFVPPSLPAPLVSSDACLDPVPFDVIPQHVVGRMEALRKARFVASDQESMARWIGRECSPWEEAHWGGSPYLPAGGESSAESQRR